MGTEERSREQRKADFEARKAERADAERVARELVEDVEMKFDEELGPRGKDWDMVETKDGPIVVARGAQVTFKKFNESKKLQIDVESFVRPLVKYPDGKTFMQMIGECPVYAVRCANALCTLYGMKAEEENGKF